MDPEVYLDRYVHADGDARAAFDRRLSAYLRGYGETWHVEVLTDALDALGEHVDDARVRLERLPDGRLSVTVTFGLAPIPVPRREAHAP